LLQSTKGIIARSINPEIKGSEMRYYKFDCGCVESVSVIKKGKLYHWKCIVCCSRHWGDISEETNKNGPKFFEIALNYQMFRISKRDAAIYKLAREEK
jgi:hypothetical protein